MLDLDTPFLPDREGCKTGRAKPECDRCGCPAKDENDKHWFGNGTGVIWNCKQQSCCLFLIFLFVYFVLFGIVQWIMFHWATYNCGSLPADYNFPGGGTGQLKNGNWTGPETNLLPRNARIVGRAPSIYGEAFDVFNATDQGMLVSAPVGSWFRTWGPWFFTYTYQDTLYSKETVYMRPTILGMTGFMTELKVMRCDGKGDVLKYSEGTAVVGNQIRSIMQSNTGRMLKLLIDGEVKAVVEETYHGTKSATFQTEGHSKRVLGSCVLTDTKDGYNSWFAHNARDSPLPFYMTDAVAVDYAFKIHNENKKHKQPSYMMLAQQFKTAVSDVIRGHKPLQPAEAIKVEEGVEEQHV